MFKWFWPGLTWTAALTALALWFGGGRLESDIAGRGGEALAPYIWASFDVDGRDVTLKGIAPNPESQTAARAALTNVRGIRDVTDLTSVLPLVSPYVLQIKKTGDGLILSGTVPDNDTRDQILAAAEGLNADWTLDDEMAVGRGSPQAFVESVTFALQLAASLSAGEIKISDLTISVKGTALSEAGYVALQSVLGGTLPFDLKLASVELARP